MARTRLTKLPKNVEELAQWYMRYISPISLVAALLLDYFVLLRRVDLWTGNLLLLFYLSLAASCITILNLIETGRLKNPWLIKITPLIPVVAQFAFGGLFTAYFSLYSRSAAVELTWIFIAILAILLVGNERFVRFYMRFTFQVSMFFAVLFSFLIFFLPVVFKQIGPYMFVVSGIVSLLLITAFFHLLAYLVPERAKAARTNVARAIAIIFLTFNLFYFSGVIPPLPLALKEGGVYHRVVREGSDYRLSYEPLRWYEAYLRYNTVYHRAPGEPVYVFSAVFAPSGLSTTIFHEWQHYDEAADEWRTDETIPFEIVGGREGGYRGYSIKTEPSPGKWRLNVLTRYGHVIGRVSFSVVATSSAAVLAEKVE